MEHSCGELAGGGGCEDTICYYGNPYAENPPCCDSSPVIIDIDGDGLALTDIAGGVDFDLNRDGAIDADDAISASLRLWQDSNHNGISDRSASWQENEIARHFISRSAGDFLCPPCLVQTGALISTASPADSISAFPVPRYQTDRRDASS